jgi:hypothetical protein
VSAERKEKSGGCQMTMLARIYHYLLLFVLHVTFEKYYFFLFVLREEGERTTLPIVTPTCELKLVSGKVGYSIPRGRYACFF